MRRARSGQIILLRLRRDHTNGISWEGSSRRGPAGVCVCVSVCACVCVCCCCCLMGSNGNKNISPWRQRPRGPEWQARTTLCLLHSSAARQLSLQFYKFHSSSALTRLHIRALYPLSQKRHLEIFAWGTHE